MVENRLENGFKVIAFLGCASALFFLLSKVLSALGKSKSKFESISAVALLILVVIVFAIIFGLDSSPSPPWERLQGK